jgi:hypothetical protein
LGFNFGNTTSPQNNGTGTGSYVYTNYRSVNGVDVARTKTEYIADHLTMTPKFSLGADLDFAPGIGPSLAVDGGFGFHGEDFGVTTKTTNDFFTASQTQVQETREEAFAEWSEMQFVITPAYRYALSLGDKVELGLRGGLAFNIATHNDKDDNYEITTNTFSFPNPADNYTQTTKVYNDTANTPQQREQTSWGIAPEASAAIQFTAIPNRLTLNAGFRLTLPGFTTTTTKITPLQSKTVTEIERADGSREEYVSDTAGPAGESISATANGWSEFEWRFGAGFSFLFNDTFSADLAFNAGNNFTNVNLTQLAVIFTVRR